jgi:hypothetical protein
MSRKQRESDIRHGLDETERDFADHFKSVGVAEGEAKRRARKIVKERGIGERVEQQHRHDPVKAEQAARNREAVEKQQRAREESADRAKHEAEKRRTGRLYFT